MRMPVGVRWVSFCFVALVQNAVAGGTIAQIQPDGQLVDLQFFDRLCSAKLLDCPSPLSLVLRARR